MKTLKIIGIVFLYVLLSCALAAYFYFSTRWVRQQSSSNRCQELLISITDSASNPLTTSLEVRQYLTDHNIAMLGRDFAQIDMNALEEDLASFASIAHCNAVRYANGAILLDIKQHQPLVKICTDSSTFFLTGQGFLFPAINPQRLPILTVYGNVPCDYPADYRGSLRPEDAWMQQLCKMAQHVESHPFWKEKAEAICVHSINDIQICPAQDSVVLNIGSLAQYDYKLDKLQHFYAVLVPLYGIQHYQKVDARFGDQLVCTRPLKKKRT